MCSLNWTAALRSQSEAVKLTCTAPKTHTFRYSLQKTQSPGKDPFLSSPNVSGLTTSQITKVWSVCNSGDGVIDSLMSQQTSKHVSLSLGSPSLFHLRVGGGKNDGENKQWCQVDTVENLGIFNTEVKSINDRRNVSGGKRAKVHTHSHVVGLN